MINKKIGILGGGQLGKMLCQDASKLGINLYILEKDDTFPAAGVCRNFFYGDFKNYDDVYAFGKEMDILTVEIEAVNTEALHALQKEGVKVYPQPEILDIIKDKGIQKLYYQKNGFPTSPFQIYESKAAVLQAIENREWTLPFVQKSRKDGYDGQGVRVIRTSSDLEDLIDAPCMIESLVDIDKEISVIVARSTTGEVRAFPVVEMEFHPTANLVEYLFSPSSLEQSIQEKAKSIAVSLVKKMEIIGLLAVELFLTKSGEILINEVAPRPHNSGHQTIEGNITSQYEQHIRAISGLPLGDTKAIAPSVMINLLGSPDNSGPTIYKNIDHCLEISGAHFHLYGKAISKPYRKMGHATVIADTLEEAIVKAKKIKKTLIIKGNG